MPCNLPLHLCIAEAASVVAHHQRLRTVVVVSVNSVFICVRVY